MDFEGGDGAGKSTQVQLLVEALRRRGYHDVVASCEPGGTDLGTSIRQALLHAGEVDPRAEALLYAADRAHHVATVIRPALDRGAIVVEDRYVDSSLAYQVAGRGLAEADVRGINNFGTGGLWPHLTVLLDIAPEAGAARLAGGEPDRLERAGGDFHGRVNACYRSLAAADAARYLVLDATQSRESIHQAVLERVVALIEGARG